jgi:hypothetical protein
MRRADLLSAMLALALAVAPTAARAQTPGPSAPAETAPAPPAPTEAAPEPGKTPSFRDEVRLFAYLEMSYTWNLGGASRGGVNELRVYDYVDGFTFNIAEFSVKKDPSERYPIGFGLVLTVGQDSQKNHSLGIFRDEDDEFPFRNTSHFDLQEAYLSVRIPLGTGLVIKAGKWVSLLGYEVIESPNNLNFSRGYLFNLAGPFTQTGVKRHLRDHGLDLGGCRRRRRFRHERRQQSPAVLRGRLPADASQGPDLLDRHHRGTRAE